MTEKQLRAWARRRFKEKRKRDPHYAALAKLIGNMNYLLPQTPPAVRQAE